MSVGMIVTRFAWAAHKLQSSKSPTCPHCRAEDTGKLHIPWYCPVLKNAIDESHPAVSNLDPDWLPMSLKYGVPPELTANPNLTFIYQQAARKARR